MVNLFNEKYSTNYLPNDLRHFHSLIDWGLKAGLSIEEAKKENYRLWYTNECLIDAAPITGAIEFLYELHKLKKNFIINSSRIPDLYESTVEWYKKHAPFVNQNQIKIGLPDIPDGAITKAYRIRSEGLRVHFEDVPEQAQAVVLYTDAHAVLLSNMATPYLVEAGRLTHIRGSNGNMPDFRPIRELFFS